MERVRSRFGSGGRCSGIPEQAAKKEQIMHVKKQNLSLPGWLALVTALVLICAGCESPVATTTEKPAVEEPAPEVPAAPGTDPWSTVKNWQSFDSLDAMSAFLAAAPANTAKTPYGIRLGSGVDVADFAVGTEIKDDKLGNLFAAFHEKYVALDLSQCAGATIAASNSTGISTREYNANKLVLIALPEGFLTLGNMTFCNDKMLLNNTSLVSVKFPIGLETIGNKVFENCMSLASVHFPEGLETIGTNAFYGTKIGSVELPEGFHQIGNSAFGKCVYLRTVTLPVSLVSLGTSVFASCPNLQSLTLRSPSMVPFKTGCIDSAKKDDPDFTIYVPSDLVDDYQADASWGLFASRFQAIAE
jgi:hypothetical protein